MSAVPNMVQPATVQDATVQPEIEQKDSKKSAERQTSSKPSPESCPKPNPKPSSESNSALSSEPSLEPNLEPSQESNSESRPGTPPNTTHFRPLDFGKKLKEEERTKEQAKGKKKLDVVLIGIENKNNKKLEKDNSESNNDNKKKDNEDNKADNDGDDDDDEDDDDEDDNDKDENDKFDVSDILNLSSTEVQSDTYKDYPIYTYRYDFEESEQEKVKKELDEQLKDNPFIPKAAPLLIGSVSKIYDKQKGVIIEKNVWVYGMNTKEEIVLAKIITPQFLYEAIQFSPDLQELAFTTHFNPAFDKEQDYQIRNRLLSARKPKNIWGAIHALNIIPHFQNDWLNIKEVTAIQKNTQEHSYELLALLRRNPAIEGCMWNFVCQFVPEEFFNILPAERAIAMPYFVLVGIAGGLGGTALGIKALKTPNVMWKTGKTANTIRILWAFRNGLTLFLGCVATGVGFDIWLFPDHAYNNTWANFFASIIAPAILTALPIGYWQSFSPVEKNAYPKLEKFMDNFLCDIALNHSIFTLFLHKVCNLSLNLSLIGGASSALVFLGSKLGLMKYKKNYSQSPTTLILYFLGGTGIYVTMKQLLDAYRRPPPEEVVDDLNLYRIFLITQNFLTAIQLGFSFFYIKKYYQKFLTNYEGDVEVGSRIAENKIQEAHKEELERKQRYNNFQKIIQYHDLYFCPQSFILNINFNSHPSSIFKLDSSNHCKTDSDRNFKPDHSTHSKHSKPVSTRNLKQDSTRTQQQESREKLINAILLSIDGENTQDAKKSRENNQISSQNTRSWVAYIIRDSCWHTIEGKHKIQLISSIEFALNSSQRNRIIFINSICWADKKKMGKVLITHDNKMIMAAIMEEALGKANLSIKPESLETPASSPLSGVRLGVVTDQRSRNYSRHNEQIKDTQLHRPLLMSSESKMLGENKTRHSSFSDKRSSNTDDPENPGYSANAHHSSNAHHSGNAKNKENTDSTGNTGNVDNAENTQGPANSNTASNSSPTANSNTAASNRRCCDSFCRIL